MVKIEYTIDESSSFFKAKKGETIVGHKYIERTGEPGKYYYKYKQESKAFSALEGVFSEIIKQDMQIKDMKKKVDDIKKEREELIVKIKPIFDEIEAETIETKSSIMTLKKILKPHVSYSKMFSEALRKLNKQTQDVLNELKEQYTEVSEYYRTSMVKKSQPDLQMISLMNKLVDLMKKRNKILNIFIKESKKVK